MKKFWKILIPSALLLTGVAVLVPVLTSCSFTTTESPNNSLINSGNARFQYYNSGNKKYVTFSIFGLPISPNYSLEWRLNDKVIEPLKFSDSTNPSTYVNVIEFQTDGTYSVYLKQRVNSSPVSYNYYHLATQYINQADFN